MKFCTKCGKQINEDAVVCPNCGCPCGSTAMAQPRTPLLKRDFSKFAGLIGFIIIIAAAVVLLEGIILWIDIIADYGIGTIFDSGLSTIIRCGLIYNLAGPLMLFGIGYLIFNSKKD